MIAANVTLPRPAGVAWREVGTVEQLREACEQEFPRCDVLLMAAAVADFRPTESLDGKLKKAGREHLRLELEADPGRAQGAGGRAAARADACGIRRRARQRRDRVRPRQAEEKGLDAVVVNDISRSDIGIGADNNEVTVVTAAGEQHVPRAAKAEVAEAILDAVERLRAMLPDAPG